MPVQRLHHVQLAMPEGGEPRAREFYQGLLGIAEVAKPGELAGRGGCWFEAGPVALHLGVEEDFRPARKAHPALVVRDLGDLEETLRAAGVAMRPNPDAAPGRGAYVDDPFGNRIELMEPDPA